MKPIYRYGVLSIFVSMSLPLAAQSTWNGTTSANWSVATNWAPGFPAAGANVTLADVTTNGLTLDDGSHTIGTLTIGTTGTRTSGFTLQTPAASTLTLTGGITANGAFTNAIGARFRGNYLISADQTVQVLGAVGSHAVDAGIAFNETTSGALPTGVSGSVTLNANLNKTGTGQLTFGATTISGAGDLNINDGSVKFNAGGSQPLTVSGAGKVAINNSGALILAKNSGSFANLPFSSSSTTPPGLKAVARSRHSPPKSFRTWSGTESIPLPPTTPPRR